MEITFNPPIGDSIQLETSLTSQAVLLHFTAELTVQHQNKLIQDRARIQLWSDLPYNGQSLSDGGWGALDLMYQAEATEETSSLRKISLGSTHPIPIHTSEEKVTLFLHVTVPLRTSHSFSFTYRIIYPSGDIKWLGAFGKNGSLSFERSYYDLRNFGLHSWTFDKSRMAHVYEVKQSVETLIVARVSDASNYRVRAIGPTSFIPDLKEAALLFFIPRSQSSAISSLPTYVFSASPGSSLTLSADGHIIASGSGTLLFQANEGHSEPLTFIRHMLSHAELDSWNVLAWDEGSKSIVLTTPKDKFPIKAVTIPLWHSKSLIRPIHLEPTILCNLLGTTEFSIFSPDNRRIHLFTIDPQATQKQQMVSFQSDTTGNDLVMSPIYTLRDHQAITDESATIWQTVILSPYQVQDSSSNGLGNLATPPPPSPPDTCVSLQSPMNGNNPQTLSSPSPAINPDANAHNTLQIQKRSPRGIIAIFKSFFCSIFFIYRIFWGNRMFGPLWRGNTTRDPPHFQVYTGPEDDVHSPLDEDGHGSKSLVGIPETKTSAEGDTKIQNTQAPPSQSYTEIPETEHALPNNTKGDVYYLQSEPSDSSSKKTTTIALLYTTHNESSTAAEDTNVITKNKIKMECCVQFLDGSEPECVVSRCDVDVSYHTRVPEEQQARSGSSYSCYLLQYQLGCGSGDLEKPQRTISISPPTLD